MSFEERKGDERGAESLNAVPPQFLDIIDERVRLQVLPRSQISIRIKDSITPLPPNYGLAAEAKNGCLKLSIQTTLQDGTRHPYFQEHRMTDLVQRVVEYFDSFEPLTTLMFNWEEPPVSGKPHERSDNYTAYLEARNSFLSNGVKPEEARMQAARATWTYQRVAKLNGFETVENVDEGPSDPPEFVEGKFSRLKR